MDVVRRTAPTPVSPPVEGNTDAGSDMGRDARTPVSPPVEGNTATGGMPVQRGGWMDGQQAGRLFNGRIEWTS